MTKKEIAQAKWRDKPESKAQMKAYQHKYYMEVKKFKKDETKT